MGFLFSLDIAIRGTTRPTRPPNQSKPIHTGNANKASLFGQENAYWNSKQENNILSRGADFFLENAKPGNMHQVAQPFHPGQLPNRQNQPLLGMSTMQATSSRRMNIGTTSRRNLAEMLFS
ncbi:hypothetical protein Nepgr_017500 [Nepenthes gracilis]|uniref:Uncharacterized protein n=1 Tax=Nepenthes gracilis TaxID=150966 RepID=A0AAD3XT57_NEPGR|nr:hypothetical protein Nepgr_017500 [Nepenthes gracilis]